MARPSHQPDPQAEVSRCQRSPWAPSWLVRDDSSGTQGPFPEPSPTGDHHHVSVHPSSVTQALTYPFLASSTQNKTGYWNSPVQGQVGLLLALGEGKGYLFSLVLGHTVEKAH